MDSEFYMEMNDLQTELDIRIGLVAVIADGLSAFSQDCCLSGEGGRRYVNALYATFDSLSAINGKLRERLDHVRDRVS